MMKTDDLAERRKTATDAKARLVDHFKTRMATEDPAVLARRAERKAIADARAERLALKAAEEAARLEAIAETERQAELVRQEEAAAREAAALAETQARQQADRERATRVVRDEAERKALRDSRYAARKSRRQG